MGIKLTSYSLPPFKELLQGIRNYSGKPQTQLEYYSYAPHANCDVRNSRQTSFSSVIETKEVEEQQNCRLVNGFFDKSPENNVHTLQFATLAKVSGSKYYSSPDSNRKKEEDILSFLTWFLPGHVTLNGSFNEMYSNLFKERHTGSVNAKPDILCGTDLHSKQFAISRDQFKKWVIEIPDELYTNVSSSLEKFSLVLHELKIMKYNYILEREIESRLRSMTAEESIWEHEQFTTQVPYNQNTDSTSSEIDKDLASPSPLRDKFTPNAITEKKLGKYKTKNPRIKRQVIKCKHCESIETPEWRRGPDGSRTLCNACGLFYSKLIKRYGSREAGLVMKQRKIGGLTNDRTIPSMNTIDDII